MTGEEANREASAEAPSPPTPDGNATKKPLFDPRFVEIVGRILVVAFLMIFVLRMAHELRVEWKWVLFLSLVAEIITVTLVVIAKLPKQVNRGLYELFITFGASFYFLLIQLKRGEPLVAEGVAISIQVAATLFQLYAKFHLGRSFGLLPANRGVVTSGPYRLVRHPIYTSYLGIQIGFLLGYFSWHNFIVYLALDLLLVLRILAEEKVLTQDPEYLAFTKTTRWRVVPFLF